MDNLEPVVRFAEVKFHGRKIPKQDFRNLSVHHLMLRLALTAAFFVFVSFVSCQNWEEVTPFPGSARDDGVAFSINGLGYAGTGRDLGFSYTNDFYSFDPATEEWSPIAPLPAAGRQYCGRFSIADTGYVVCGISPEGYLNELWAYHPDTDTWTQKSSYPGKARSSPIAFAIAGKAYVGTGRNGDTYFDDFWEYDPATDGWSPINNFPGGKRFEALGMAIGAFGYAGLGRLQSDTITNDWWQFNPESGEWNQKVNFPGATRYYAIESAMNGRGMVAGGQDENLTYRNEAYSYNPIDDSWTALPPLPFGGTKGTFAFSVNSDFFIGTGINSQNVRQNRLYKMEVRASQELNFTIYPNPFQNALRVSSSASQIRKARIYSINGSIVLEKFLPVPTQLITLYLSTLADNIYFIELEWENGKTTRSKILKVGDLSK